ncbi:MAG: hypothetical protein K6F21_02565 [Bacteroidales bacterium]|nr:hypothetical protein [Bacteroidales bacterium]
MRKIFAILVAALIAVLLSSCNKDDNYGYPAKVSFTAEGGVLYVYGEKHIHFLSIADYDGKEWHDETPQDSPMLSASHDWLTAVYDSSAKKITITAAANLSGEKRTLYVRGSVKDSVADIKVEQN